MGPTGVATKAGIDTAQPCSGAGPALPELGLCPGARSVFPGAGSALPELGLYSPRARFVSWSRVCTLRAGSVPRSQACTPRTGSAPSGARPAPYSAPYSPSWVTLDKSHYHAVPVSEAGVGAAWYSPPHSCSPRRLWPQPSGQLGPLRHVGGPCSPHRSRKFPDKDWNVRGHRAHSTTDLAFFGGLLVASSAAGETEAGSVV